MITPERWAEFHALVRDTRRVQQLYRRTMDPVARREAEAMEDRVDTWVGWLAADLAAEAPQPAIAVDPLMTAEIQAKPEGGVS